MDAKESVLNGAEPSSWHHTTYKHEEMQHLYTRTLAITALRIGNDESMPVYTAPRPMFSALFTNT